MALTVDYTTLRGVAECSTKAAMTSVLALQPKGTRLPLEAGIGVHAALAEWLESQSASKALSIFEGYYKPIWEKAVRANEVPESLAERMAFETVRKILAFWFKQRAGGSFFPYTLEPGMTEIAVTRSLGVIGGEEITYVALIDAIVRSRAGGRWLMDHKSTGSNLNDWWMADQDVSGQFVGQRWAGAEYDVEGVAVNGIQVRKLNTSTKRCPQHGVPYNECALQHCDARIKTVAVTPQQLEEFPETVTRLVKKYQRIRRQVETVEDIGSQPKEGWFTGACKLCDYKDWCHQGRNVTARVIEAKFEVRRWDPLAEAKARRVRGKKENTR